MFKKTKKKTTTDDLLGLYVAQRTDGSGIAPEIVTYYDPESILAEQYRIIRTHIRQINPETPLKTLVVTSTAHKEGKSVTAVNLAIVMAKRDEEKKICLLDCDMRKGTVHQLMGLKQLPGLSEILSGEVLLDMIIQKNKISNLDIITHGDNPPNPSELLSSGRMKNLLELLKSKYDVIIIDAPPVLPVTDTHILAHLVDGVIMVVRANHIQRAHVLHAQDLLRQVHANMLGFIFTQVEHYVPRYFYKPLEYTDDYYYK
ncbi:CpsD/CapB family tyrosine-protein kinase [bacterium]|nr:CpsD/CapB family tyrosine-protein kinase [bacterium]